MTTRILKDQDVYRLLPMDRAVDLMEDALTAASRGEYMVPLRQGLDFPRGGGLLALMPALTGKPRASGVKVMNVVRDNHATPYDTHQGVILYFEGDHGRLRAVIDASSVTAVRTAAASGAATRHLAREDAVVLGVFGSGVQARHHVAAMKAVRPIERVWVHTLSEAHAVSFQEDMQKLHDVPVEISPDPETVCVKSDILCTATSSKTPVFQGEWVQPGTHINAVGACMPHDRELDTKTVIKSRLFTDRRESLWAEAGDVMMPLEERAIDESHLIGEVGELFAGDLKGRRNAEDVTLFKSLGFAAEDMAVARFLAEAAEKENQGLELDLGGRVRD